MNNMTNVENIDNIVILRSVFGKVGMKYYMNPIKDPKTGRFPDNVRTVDSFGNMILSDKDKNNDSILIPENKLFIIEDGRSFNLDDPWEKADWEAIKNCPIIAQSRDMRDAKGDLLIDGNSRRYGIAELYIERPGYEVAKKVSKKKKIHDAESYIYGDPQGSAGRLKMARLLGKNMKNSPDPDVADYLLEIASKNPDKIIDLYTGDDMTIRLLFMDARDKNIIYIKNKLFLYSDNVVLGATDDSAITWLKDSRNYKVLQLIKRDTYPELFMSNEQETKLSTTQVEDIVEKPTSKFGKRLS